MTTVNVGYGTENPTHDVSITDDTTTHGLIFPESGIRVLQEHPLSAPAAPFAIEQQNWIGGRGKVRYIDDPTGFNDSTRLWSTTEGKLMPSLQHRFADGIRSHTSYFPGNNQDYAWWKLYGNTPASKIVRYLSVTFTPSASYTARDYFFWIRRRGTPGTLTFELCSNSSGSPGSVLHTVTKTTSDITDTVAEIVQFSATQALTGSTAYHLKIYGAATDDADNHWEVLSNDDGTSSKYSSNNSSWTAAGVTMYYRVTDARSPRQWFLFELLGATYAVSKYDATTNSKLYINGVRGTATSATSTSLTCSALSMTADQYIDAYIRIIDGTGDGQVRQITDNTTTAFTVDDWDVTPSTDSRFVVYSTDYWTEITSTGLGKITGKPAVAGKIAYFPQGQSVNIRRMRVNGNSHDFAADSTNKADLIYVHAEGTTPKVYAAHADSAYIKASDTKAWGTDLAFGDQKDIGSTDQRITNMFGHNKALHVFKYDGPYSYSGVVEKLGGNFDDIPDPSTGLGVAAQGGALWFGWAHSVMRMVGASTQDMMNFKLGYDGMGAGKRGYVSSIVSAVGWLFVCMKGDVGNRSTILVWNGYGWHEIYKSWKNHGPIRNLHWQPNIESRSRLWFDVDGDLAYIEFPQYSANPLKDSSINFEPEGVCVTSTIDARDPQLYKILAMLRAYSEQGGCEVDYQTNADVGTSTWTVLGTASTQPVQDLDIDVGGVFQARLRVRLQSARSRNQNILNGWLLSGRQMPLDKYRWIGTFRADTDAESYGDEPDHDPSTVYSQIQTWARQQTKLTLRSASQSMDNKTVTVSMPEKTVDWVDGTSWGGTISFAMMET
jgi:hypothetical protein